MFLLTTIFEFVGGVICLAVAIGVIYVSVKGIMDYISDHKNVMVFKSSNVKCSKCGMTYSISAKGHERSTYDAFCPFCGRQSYLISPDVKAAMEKSNK